MGYINNYRNRVQSSGNNYQSRTENRLAADFKLFQERSPNRTLIRWKDQEFYGVLESGLRTAAQSERQIVSFLLIGRERVLSEGDTFSTWDKDFCKVRNWIVLNAEVRTFRGYFRYKVLELDYTLKYVDNNGIVQEVDCYLNGTGPYDIKEYFKFTQEPNAQLPNKALNVIWPSNPDLNPDYRFIAGDEVWRYVDSDKVSIPGVYYSTLYKIATDEYNDSIKDQIARVNKIGTVSIVSSLGDKPVMEIGDSLKFYLRADDILTESKELSYNYYNSPIIKYENGVFKAEEEGRATITVKKGSLEKDFEVEIVEDKGPYFRVFGDNRMRETQGYEILVETNQDYTFTYDKTYLSIEQNDNTLSVKCLKRGKTSIEFVCGNDIISYPIEIVSLWVK